LNSQDPITVAVILARLLEEMRVPYLIGGSVASSALGIPRFTLDVDLVADLRPEHAEALVNALEKEFYVELDSVREAIQQRTSFNVIHLETMLKADLFVLKRGAWPKEEMSRRREIPIEGGEPAVLFFATAEDIILHKIEWYRAGGGVSDRQWNDLLGVLKVQGDALDLAYLRRWADELGLNDLLDRALEDAGLSP
jgi:hypothetical protein